MKKKIPDLQYNKLFKVMRIPLISLFIVCSTALSLTAGSTFAQNILDKKISVEMNGIQLSQALDKISKSADVKFVFSNDVLKNKDQITVNFKNEKLGKILEKLFNKDFTYEVINNEIVVHQNKQEVPIARTSNSWVVRGKVIDEKNLPILGATVLVKGTRQAMPTDINGNFLLEVATDNATLVVSYTTYITQEIPVSINGNREITIKLLPDEEKQKLNEVVIVGFGKQKKVSVTGAISMVSVKDLEKSSTPSLSNAIGGRLPGIITRQSSGEPGYDQAQVFIRGLGTWVNRAPLILVDGVPRDMNNLNIQEIESYSILKDASATAVYGVQGANGVILIQTKKGSTGKPKIIFRTENASLHALRLPNYINGYEYAGLINEALTNVGQPARFTPVELQKFKDHSDPYVYPDVNWTDLVLKKDTYQSINNFSINGGTDFIKYYTNVGYTLQSGLWKEDNLKAYSTNANTKRYNFRSNVDINATNSLSFSLGIGGIIQNNSYPGTSAAGILDAMRSISPIDYPVFNPDGSVSGGPSYKINNPYAQVTQAGYQKQYLSTLQATFSSRWDLSNDITRGLSVRGMFAYDSYNYTDNIRSIAYGVKQYKRDAVGNDVYSVIRQEQPMGYGFNNNNNRAIYMEGGINYNRGFNKHDVSAMVLYNQREQVFLSAPNSTQNLPYRRQGLATRVSYGYDNRYLAEFNAGYNGSEQFPPGKRFGFFPSISGGWVISNEKFWKSNLVNNLKIRGSYGKVGNDQIADAATRFLYRTIINRNGSNYLFGSSQNSFAGFNEALIGVQNLRWEVANKTNIGFDVELLNSRVILQVDVFKEYRDGILMLRQTIPAFAGLQSASVPYGNLGVVDNRGFDGSLEIKNRTQSGLYYSFIGNFTYAHNTVIENDEPNYIYRNLALKGHPIDSYRGLVAEGIFQSQAEINSSPSQTYYMSSIRPGDIKYRDVNGDGKINDNDRTIIGSPRTPEIMYGFGGTVAYKGFDMSVFFTGAARSSVYVSGNSIFPFNLELGNYNILREYYDNRWTAANPGGKYPEVINGNSPNNFQLSTQYLIDGSYLRLRNAEIGYTLSASLLKRLNIKSIRVFTNGINLYTWDHVKFMDPESNNGNGSYPLQRTLNAGLQINF